MSRPMTAYEYACSRFRTERFPSILIDRVAGDFYLCDDRWDILRSPTFKSAAAAERWRSKLLDRAQKACFRLEGRR